MDLLFSELILLDFDIILNPALKALKHHLHYLIKKDKAVVNVMAALTDIW